MSKGDGIEDKEIKDFFYFLKVANETIKEKGIIYDFTCPLCEGQAQGIKNTHNEHLWAKCEKCNMSIIQ